MSEKELLATLRTLKAKDLSNGSNSLSALFDFLSVKRIVETSDVAGNVYKFHLGTIPRNGVMSIVLDYGRNEFHDTHKRNR
jgi:hypothetical protein